MQAIVLVGGEGTRLRPLTDDVPKPALTLVDRPFLAYMIEWLAGHGVTEAVLACGFLPDVLREALGDGERAGVRLTYVTEPDRRGTAGAIRFAADALGDRLEDRFLALNGDVLTDLDLTALMRAHRERAARATIALYPVEDSAAYGLVSVDADGLGDASSSRRPGEAAPGEINAGAYFLERSVLDLIPPEREVSIEREVFPRLIGDGLGALRLDGYWMDIGTPRALPAGELGHPRGPGGDAGPARPRPACSSAPAPRSTAAPRVGPRAVVSPGCRIAAGAEVRESVLLGGCSVGEGAARQRRRACGRASLSMQARELDGAIVGRDERVPGQRTMIDDVLGIPDQLRDALWRIESARLEPAEAAGADGLRHGRLGDRRRSRRRRARRPPDPAAAHRPRLRAAELGDAGVDRALLELLGQHRGDARLLRRRRGARRPPHRRQHRRRAGRQRSRGGRAGGRPAGDLPASRRSRLHVRRRRRGRGAGRCSRPASTPRSTPPPPSSQASPRPCRPAPPRSPPSSTARSPVVYGADLTAPVARRWKSPGQRERQAPGLLLRAARGRPQRALRLGDRRTASLAAVFLEDRDQHPRERRRFELTAAAVAADGRRRGPRRDRRRDPRRPPALGDDAGRPGLARAGRGARGRPAPGRGDRALQAGDGAGHEGDGPGRRPRHPPAADHLRDAEADGAGPEPAGDGAHPPPARPPWLHRDDRQPALVPGR